MSCKFILYVTAFAALSAAAPTALQPPFYPSYIHSDWIPLASHGLFLPHSEYSLSTLPIITTAHAQKALPLILPTKDVDDENSLFGPAILSGGFDWDEDVEEGAGWETASAGVWKRDNVEPELTSRDITRRNGSVAWDSESQQLAYSVEQVVSQQQKVVRRGAKKEAAKLMAIGKTVVKAAGDIMKGATIKTTITWYTGRDLLNPYCERQSKWTPTDTSLIVAVTQKWDLRPACGEFLEIVSPSDPSKSVVARVVDLCGGCKPDIPHADLSKAAFSKLLALNAGIGKGLLMRKVPPPKVWDDKLYGPKVL